MKYKYELTNGAWSLMLQNDTSCEYTELQIHLKDSILKQAGFGSSK